MNPYLSIIMVSRNDDHGEGLLKRMSLCINNIIHFTNKYKIDTELRPEGGSGVLVLSVKGYENYFKSRARIWEQQAMVRARVVAGNKEVGKKFLVVAHNFVFQEKFEYNSLIEISRLRERIEIELAQEKTKGKNVKLGFGGIADIEFVMQILQLIHGKKNPRLRETNTIEAINKFVKHGMLKFY